MAEQPITMSLALKSTKDLYAAHMPFIKEGGLFIATTNDYEMGSPVLLELDLMDEPEIYKIDGKIVWKTPPGAQGNLNAGIGIQLESEEGHKVQKKINAYLVGASKSDDQTDTM